jgi:predicted RNA-binding protein with PIN domain
MEISTLLVDEYNEIKNYQELKKVYTPGVRSLVELSS